MFISSTRQDFELARDMARRLRAAGLEPLTDPTLRPGENFSKRVGEVIRSADAILFLLTPAALDSPWTAYETGVADGADKPTLLVVAGTGQRPLPPLLQSYETFPYDQLDEAVMVLAQRLSAAAAHAETPRRS